MSFTPPPKSFDLDMLPRPVIEGREEWIAAHDLAWRIAHAHIGHHATLAAPWCMDEACMPDRLWQWDTCFMALYCCYAPDVFPGIESLDNFYAWQRDDGFIAMCTLFESGEPAYGERINPPLFAWVEWEYYRHTGNDSRFARVLPVLVRYFDWIVKNRTRPRLILPEEELAPTDRANDTGGLYWATAAGAMGMDNSPRAAHLSWTGGEICWIDLSSQQALAARYMAKIARQIGDTAIADRFEWEYRRLGDMINQWMWCEKSRFYHDIFLDGNFLSCKTVAGFWPMLAGFAGQDQAARLNDHMNNPETFGRPHPVPSLAADDPNYCPSGGYWLGGVWAPTNYMAVRGLCEYAFDATAHDIAVKHLDGIVAVRGTTKPDTIWEAYAPDQMTPSTGKDKKKYARPDFCGWSALGATSMLYENIIGIRRDTPAKTLSWDIRLNQNHGFDRYPLLGGDLCIRYHATTRTIEIDSPAAFTLKWRRADEQGEAAVQSGSSRVAIR